MSNVCPSVFVVDIQRVKTTPVVPCFVKFAFFIPNKPIRMFFEKLGRWSACKRSKPQSCNHTTFVNFVCNGFHPTWKFFVVSNKPIANCLLISVINLETIKFHILIYYAVQISVNNLFGNIVVVIIPSCVAIAFFCFSTRGADKFEIFVKSNIIFACNKGKLQKLAWIVIGYAFKLFWNDNVAVVAIKSNNSVAVFFCQCSKNVHIVIIAHISIWPTIKNACFSWEFPKIVVAWLW